MLNLSTSNSRQQAQSYAAHVAKALGGALLLLLLFELVAYFGFHERPLERLDFGYAQDSGFQLQGDGKIMLQRVAFRGLWQQDYPLKKQPGVLRIMLIGDSVFRGASYEDSLAGSLRQEMQNCGIAAEVWSLASPGYGSRRKAILVDKALSFDPDLLIYHANITTEYEDAREWQRKQQHRSWHPSLWLEKLPFIGRLILSKTEKVYWKWLPEAVRAAVDTPITETEQALRSKEDTAYWMPTMLTHLTETLQQIQQAHVPLLVLTRTSVVAPSGAMTDYGLDDAVAALSPHYGHFVTVSSRKIFTGVEPHLYFSDNAHWTSQGHQRVATALLPNVLALLANKYPSLPTCRISLEN